MQRLHVQLRFALDLDKSHGGPSRRLGDCFGVTIIVLLRLDVGTYVLRRPS